MRQAHSSAVEHLLYIQKGPQLKGLASPAKGFQVEGDVKGCCQIDHTYQDSSTFSFSRKKLHYVIDNSYLAWKGGCETWKKTCFLCSCASRMGRNYD